MTNFDFSDSSEEPEIIQNPYEHNYEKLSKLGTFDLQTNYSEQLQLIHNQQKKITESEFTSAYENKINQQIAFQPHNAALYVNKETNSIQSDFKTFTRNYAKKLIQIRKKIDQQLNEAETPLQSQKLKIQLNEIDKIYGNLQQYFHERRETTGGQNISMESCVSVPRQQQNYEYLLPKKPLSEQYFSTVAERNFFDKRKIHPIIMPQALRRQIFNYDDEVYSPELIYDNNEIPMQFIGQKLKNVVQLPSCELNDFEANCVFALVTYVVRFHSEILFSKQKFSNESQQLLYLQYYILPGKVIAVLLEAGFEFSRGRQRNEIIGNIAIGYNANEEPQLVKGDVKRLKIGCKLVRFDYEKIKHVWARLMNVIKEYIWMRM